MLIADISQFSCYGLNFIPNLSFLTCFSVDKSLLTSLERHILIFYLYPTFIHNPFFVAVYQWRLYAGDMAEESKSRIIKEEIDIYDELPDSLKVSLCIKLFSY